MCLESEFHNHATMHEPMIRITTTIITVISSVVLTVIRDNDQNSDSRRDGFHPSTTYKLYLQQSKGEQCMYDRTLELLYSSVSSFRISRNVRNEWFQ